MRAVAKSRRGSGQLGLFHGSMSADVQSALRRLERTIERIPEDDMARRRRRWEEISGLIDGNISGRTR